MLKLSEQPIVIRSQRVEIDRNRSKRGNHVLNPIRRGRGQTIGQRNRPRVHERIDSLSESYDERGIARAYDLKVISHRR
jgi:hypothetical protein